VLASSLLTQPNVQVELQRLKDQMKERFALKAEAILD